MVPKQTNSDRDNKGVQPQLALIRWVGSVHMVERWSHNPKVASSILAPGILPSSIFSGQQSILSKGTTTSNSVVMKQHTEHYQCSQNNFPRRDLNPGLAGESRIS